jgi:hypothetical protein
MLCCPGPQPMRLIADRCILAVACVTDGAVVVVPIPARPRPNSTRLADDGCGDRCLATDDGVRDLGRRVRRMEATALVLIVLVEELRPIVRR